MGVWKISKEFGGGSEVEGECEVLQKIVCPENDATFGNFVVWDKGGQHLGIKRLPAHKQEDAVWTGFGAVETVRSQRRWMNVQAGLLFGFPRGPFLPGFVFLQKTTDERKFADLGQDRAAHDQQTGASLVQHRLEQQHDRDRIRKRLRATTQIRTLARIRRGTDKPRATIRTITVLLSSHVS